MSVFVPRIRVVLPDTKVDVHAHAFDEISLSLVAALIRLGFDVEPTRASW